MGAITTMAGNIGSAQPYLDGTHEAELCLTAMLPYSSGNGTCYHFRDAGGHIIVHFSKKRVTLASRKEILASEQMQIQFSTPIPK